MARFQRYSYPFCIGGGDVPGTAYEVSWVDGVPVVWAPAEIDVTNAGGLRRAMQSCTDAGYTTLVVDMSETTFCDSAGVRAIIAAHKQAAAAGCQLRLVATAAALRVLTLVGADQLIPIYPTLEAALAGTTPDSGQHA
jgi:anti-sigma B factor antagonist